MFKVGVVIPSYRVSKHILSVIGRIEDDVASIYVVDDCCPEGSGELVQAQCKDPRVKVIFNKVNLGVGGATIAGYLAALEDRCDCVVKLDGDGQMDPSLIPVFVRPLQEGVADYAKGNRFFDWESVEKMPRTRLWGNAVLSFMTKLSSGYWRVFDPTNGFTAIHACALLNLPLEKVANRYFFESDMLFRLNTIKAVVQDLPMRAVYGDEESNLSILLTIPTFMWLHTRNLAKRIFYNYFLRDFNIGSIELVAGLLMSSFGFLFGLFQWYRSISTGVPVSSGTVMVAALPIILGVQMLLSFLSYDVGEDYRYPCQKRFKSGTDK